MSSTYSINPGTPTEAFKLADINSVLNELPDNTQKLINPHDIRDAVYTSWENIIFKPTTNNAAIEYVGIDKTNFYEQIFLGKKQISGVDVLSANLLNSDVDIFLYNTKTDVDLANQNTRIGFLAGADTSLFYYGSTLSTPLIESKVVVTTGGNVIDLDIKNFSYVTSGLTSYGGNINIYSNYGYVALNGLFFPTLTQNSGITPGYILTYQSGGYLQWSPNTVTVTSISQSGTFSISANPLYINGYNAMFSSNVPTPTAFGGIAAGSTFSNVAVTEIIRQMLYPYIQPTLSLTAYTPIVEASSNTITLTFSYTITKYVANSSISNIYSTPIFTSSDLTTAKTYLNAAPTTPRIYTGTASYNSVVSGPLSFTLSVNDGTATYSTNSVVTPVYPIFYGTTTVATSSQTGVQSILGTFSKILNINPNQTISLNGNGVCIYYLVPQIYNISGSMSGLYSGYSDSLNQNLVFRGNGTPFTMSLNSPDSIWSSIIYNCYIYSPNGMPTITTIGSYPLYSATYQFLF